VYFRLSFLLLGSALTFAAPGGLIAAAQARHFLLVVWDGMRPDYVSLELTPTLWSLRTNGVWFANHHSAYPTSTEVNGAVLATGAFPQRNRIVANKDYRREIDPLKQFGTQSLRAIRRGDELSGGRYVGLPTVAERVQAGGLRTAVVGAKPVALLHDRLARGEEAPGSVWFVEGALPELQLGLLTNRFGGFPAAMSPNFARDFWATRCLTVAFWEREVPRYSLLWLSEPDYSQHEHGPGSPEALASIRGCDQRLAEVLAELDRRGVRSQTDVLVVSDHGFSTIGANTDVAAALRASGVNAWSAQTNLPAGSDVAVVGNGGSVLLYVNEGSRVGIPEIVRTLQRQPFAGVIFTREALPGTFPLAEAMLAAPNAPDIVVATRWVQPSPTNAHPISLVFNDGYNEYEAGCGMHVTLCPTDLHNIAVAVGPDFRQGLVNSLPSGNVDIAPTLLWLMGIQPAERLDGRVLSEALRAEGPPVGKVSSDRRDARVDLGNGVWEQYLKFTELNGVRYLDEGNGACLGQGRR
jgi:predicted AlkP superfamily pyrophosphatase or phosphodiesterase